MIAGSGQLTGEMASALVDDARAGDETAFARIVARYHPDLLRIALVVCGDVDIAADAAQAAWAVAWRRMGDLRDPANLRPWLMSIAANEARQITRSRGRRTVREVTVLDPSTPSADAMVAERIDLANALATLEPRDRELLGLRYLAGLDSTEIGRAVGMSAVAVRTRLARARDRLRQELGDD
jgi:RNA polymerase sigma-70 factor (ECF subfamily)